MDAEEALRRYLEQRRELGESELVLDSLSVDEAMKLLGAAKRTKPKHAPREAVADAASATDWREAVRAAGGAPQARPSIGTPVIPSVPVAPATAALPAAVHVPSTQAATSPPVRLEDVPLGLTVGGASHSLADDPAGKLTTLAEIAETIAKCTRCSLYATAKNPVPGSGNPNADFMCV
ncbi:MAG: hypothetical protein ABIY52_04345, partial [Gemmatimonadaceae bacterium]